jgi:hypothetical protein
MPTLDLVATEVYPTRVIPPVPIGPPQPTGGPPDLGTVQVFSDVIRQGTAVVGEHSGTCVHVRAPNTWFCHAGWHLKGVDPNPPGGTTLTGTLVAGGLLDYDDPLPTFVVAIFGGTGDFQHVVGEIHGEYVAPRTNYELDFKTVP